VAASGHGKDKDSGVPSTAALPWGLGGSEKFDGGTIDSRQKMFRSSYIGVTVALPMLDYTGGSKPERCNEAMPV